MQSKLLICIALITSCKGCNNQKEESVVKYHTLISGSEISINSKVGRWHITIDSKCKAKLTCPNFYIPPSKDCLTSSLEVIDGDRIKLRFCGYSKNLGKCRFELCLFCEK